MTRKPAVAGAFYDGEARALRSTIEECFTGRLGPGSLPETRPERLGKVMGLVCPHAGYMYSGSAAAFAYKALAEDGLPRIAVILGPNHTSLGAAVAVAADDEWVTPLGSVSVARETADAILRGCEFAGSDDLAHAREHSIEVQIPFLQFIGGDGVKIVPISIAHLSEHNAAVLARSLGQAIASALDGEQAVVIASTDFTHYESRTSALEKDSAAIGHILELDAEGLISTVYSRDITMCGVAGTAVMIEACRAMGASSARKLAYYTSGDVVGDMTQVVGYGAMSVER